MRKVIIAALLALTPASMLAVPAHAASLTITTDDGPRWRDHDWRENGYRDGWRKHRRHNDGMSFSMNSRRDYRDCEVVIKRYWRNGERVTEKIRDCD